MNTKQLKQLKALLELYEERVDGEPVNSKLDMDIMSICMRIPAGYEDLLEDHNAPLQPGGYIKSLSKALGPRK